MSGVIDAAVNGGTKLYRDAFLNPTFVQKEPDKQKSGKEYIFIHYFQLLN